MSCRRAFEIDLAGFLHAPRDAEWAAFRDHYPTCASCAAEVAAWTELEGRLGAASAHPEPAVLLQWAERPDALEADTRRRVALHVDGCASCAEELRVLGRFDAAALADSAAAAPQVGAAVGTARLAASETATERTAREAPPVHRTRRSPLRTVGRVLWHPAFAWAAVLLLALPTLLERHDEVAVVAPSPPPPATGRAPEPPERDAAADDVAGLAGVPGERPSDHAARGAGSDGPPAETAAPPRAKDEDRASPEPRAVAPAPSPPPAAKAAPLADRLRDEMQPGTLDRLDAEAPARQHQAPATAPGASAAQSEHRSSAEGRAVADGQAAPSPSALVARLEAGSPNAVLHLILPPAAHGAASLDVRLRAASDERELRQRLTPTGGAAAVRVPASWLVPGRYVVEVWVGARRLGDAVLDVP